MRIAYFTAGTVGAGHLVRGLAIERALARRGFDGTYATFGPTLPFPIASQVRTTPVAIVERELRDPIRAVTTPLAAALQAYRPDLLLVDMFWAPLRHVLPMLRCEAWLLVRSCPAAWFQGPADTRYAPSLFRRVIGIEPIERPEIREHVDPVVVCNPDECRPPGALRARLGVADGQPLVVVVHAGVAGEVMQLDPGGDDAAWFDLFAEDALFPLAEWLGDADEIHCAAGYNTFWEARWLGYAPRARFTALPRQIDDQAWRLRECADHPMPANGADTLAGWMIGD